MKPILFNTEMVRAILDGRKTVTRRVIKPQPELKGLLWTLGDAKWSDGVESFCPMIGHSLYNRMPYKPDNVLWVRETWQPEVEHGWLYNYKVDNDGLCCGKWRPSIHMPREAARLFLRVTDVRLERLQEATLYGFLDEGVSLRPEAFNDPDNAYLQARHQFSDIWDSTIKKTNLPLHGWNVNPWVWVIKFERCGKP